MNGNRIYSKKFNSQKGVDNQLSRPPNEFEERERESHLQNNNQRNRFDNITNGIHNPNHHNLSHDNREFNHMSYIHNSNKYPTRKLIDVNPYQDENEFPDESSLFIGDLSRNVTEEMLHQHFESCGEIDVVDIKRDKVTKHNLGYGFVKFRRREDASKAKRDMNLSNLGGRTIRIGWAQKNTNLFVCLVGDEQSKITGEHLQKIFSKFGPLYIKDTFVKQNKYGFVKFMHRRHAEEAKATLDNKHLSVPGGGTTEKPVRIGWGDANTQRNCVHVQFEQKPAAIADLNENDFTAQFERFGEVAKVSLPRYSDRKLKGYGFIHYPEDDDGEESAARAITALTNTTIKNVVILCNFGKRQNQRHKRFAQKRQQQKEEFNMMNKYDTMGNDNLNDNNNINELNNLHHMNNMMSMGMNNMSNLNIGNLNMQMNNMNVSVPNMPTMPAMPNLSNIQSFANLPSMPNMPNAMHMSNMMENMNMNMNRMSNMNVNMMNSLHNMRNDNDNNGFNRPHNLQMPPLSQLNESVNQFEFHPTNPNPIQSQRNQNLHQINPNLSVNNMNTMNMNMNMNMNTMHMLNSMNNMNSMSGTVTPLPPSPNRAFLNNINNNMPILINKLDNLKRLENKNSLQHLNSNSNSTPNSTPNPTKRPHNLTNILAPPPPPQSFLSLPPSLPPSPPNAFSDNSLSLPMIPSPPFPQLANMNMLNLPNLPAMPMPMPLLTHMKPVLPPFGNNQNRNAPDPISIKNANDAGNSNVLGNNANVEKCNALSNSSANSSNSSVGKKNMNNNVSSAGNVSSATVSPMPSSVNGLAGFQHNISQFPSPSGFLSPPLMNSHASPLSSPQFNMMSLPNDHLGMTMSALNIGSNPMLRNNGIRPPNIHFPPPNPMNFALSNNSNPNSILNSNQNYPRAIGNNFISSGNMNLNLNLNVNRNNGLKQPAPALHLPNLNANNIQHLQKRNIVNMSQFNNSYDIQTPVQLSPALLPSIPINID